MFSFPSFLENNISSYLTSINFFLIKNPLKKVDLIVTYVDNLNYTLITNVNNLY